MDLLVLSGVCGHGLLFLLDTVNWRQYKCRLCCYLQSQVPGLRTNSDVPETGGTEKVPHGTSTGRFNFRMRASSDGLLFVDFLAGEQKRLAASFRGKIISQ